MSVMKIQNTPEWTDAVHTFQYTANVHPRIIYTTQKIIVHCKHCQHPHTKTHLYTAKTLGIQVYNLYATV